MAKTAVDKLRAMVDGESLRAVATELLEELSDARELAEAWTAVADAIETAESDVEQWTEAEDREERADAKETAISSLQEMLDAIEELRALVDTTGLDISETV